MSSDQSTKAIPAPTILRQLVNLGKRSRDLHEEGGWGESLDEEAQQERAKLVSLQKKADIASANAKKLSEWDQQLDQGRMKKLKKKKESYGNGELLADNPFQEKLNRDREAAAK